MTINHALPRLTKRFVALCLATTLPLSMSSIPVVKADSTVEQRILFTQVLGNVSHLFSINIDGTNRTDIGPAGAFDVSSDGKKIVYDGSGCPTPAGNAGEICTMNANATNIISLTNYSTAQEENPFWSNDDSKVYFQGGEGTVGGLYVMNADGSDKKSVLPGIGSPDVSPNNTQVVFVDNDGRIAKANLDGTNLTILTPVADGGSDPKWSPDGLNIVWSHDGIISYMAADGSNKHDLYLDPGYAIEFPAWSTDGTRIIFFSSDPTGSHPSIMSVDLQGNSNLVYSGSGEGFLNIMWTNIQTSNFDTTSPSGTFGGNGIVLRLLGQTITGTALDNSSGVEKVTLVSGTTILSSTGNGGITLNCPSQSRLSCSWSAVATNLPLGVNAYILTVTDQAGNTYTTSKQYIVL